MLFASRHEAGRQLGHRLQQLAVDVDLVAGLPRGGMVVAAEVADVLQRPLGVLVVRKIGHPHQREFAVGALAEEEVVILDHDTLSAVPIAYEELQLVVDEEKMHLHEHCLKFRNGHDSRFADGRVLLVDDGLATGATAEAAVYAARKKGAREIIVAAPIAATSACERLELVADRIITLFTDPDLSAVGQYYRWFTSTSDEEVLALLHHPHADYGPVA